MPGTFVTTLTQNTVLIIPELCNLVIFLGVKTGLDFLPHPEDSVVGCSGDNKEFYQLFLILVMLGLNQQSAIVNHQFSIPS